MAPERAIKTYGERGYRVRLYRTVTRIGTKLLRAEWRERGKKQRQTWPDTREYERLARGYAEGVAFRLAGKAPAATAPITMGELAQRYQLAHDHWRPATVSNRMGRVRIWLRFVGEAFPARDVTHEMLDEFRRTLRTIPREKTRQPMAANQIAATCAEVKALLRFAKLRKLVPENPLADYTIRLGKDETRHETREYTNDEWARMIAALSPKRAQEWRPYVLMVLAGILGPRQKALRGLEWRDVDLHERTVQWRPELDKMASDRRQPLPRAAVRAFRIAKVWRARDGYQGAFVFYVPRGTKARGVEKPYSAQSLAHWQIEAERRGGVEHIPYRGMHGFRRTSAGNVLAATGGDVKAAGDWIGDRDLRSLQKYLKKRDERMRTVAGLLEVPTVEDDR